MCRACGLPKRASPRMRVLPRRQRCPLRVRSAHPPSAASTSSTPSPRRQPLGHTGLGADRRRHLHRHPPPRRAHRPGGHARRAQHQLHQLPLLSPSQLRHVHTCSRVFSVSGVCGSRYVTGGAIVGEVSYKGHRYPAEIIAHCVWLYHPVTAELPRDRGAHGGPWRDRHLRDDPAVVRQVRTRLRGRAAPPPTPTRRHVASRRSVLDDQRPWHYLWRAVDQDGNVLDILVQPRRDAKAAKHFFRKLLKKQCACPRVLVTDKLRSYQTAHRAVMSSVEHRQSKYLLIHTEFAGARPSPR